MFVSVSVCVFVLVCVGGECELSETGCSEMCKPQLIFQVKVFGGRFAEQFHAC